ncbi:hypothetical protein GX408_07385 [bacterium]|nr:hypothetical protein [bacterium]
MKRDRMHCNKAKSFNAACTIKIKLPHFFLNVNSRKQKTSGGRERRQWEFRFCRQRAQRLKKTGTLFGVLDVKSDGGRWGLKK